MRNPRSLFPCHFNVIAFNGVGHAGGMLVHDAIEHLNSIPCLCLGYSLFVCYIRSIRLLAELVVLRFCTALECCHTNNFNRQWGCLIRSVYGQIFSNNHLLGKTGSYRPCSGEHSVLLQYLATRRRTVCPRRDEAAHNPDFVGDQRSFPYVI